MSDKLITYKKMKHDTLMNILLAIRKGCKTKRAIQKETGISWGTCSENINHLERIGLIMIKSIDGEGLPGPKSNMYAFNPNNFTVLGIEIAVKQIIVSLASLDGVCLLTKKYVQTEELDNNNIQHIIKQIFYQFLGEFSINEETIYAVHFALSGAVSTKDLIWIQSPKFEKIKKVDFGCFHTIFPKVKVINLIHDVQARAVDLQHKRANLGDHFLFLHISNGVGLSIYSEKHFISGFRGLAGEVGHIPYFKESLIPFSPCFCGQSYCIENLLHCEKLLAYCRHNSSIPIASLDELDTSSTLYQTLFDHIEEVLLHLCRTLINIFDSKTIILGGKSLTPWKEPLQKSFLLKLQNISWEKGPHKFIFYHEEENNPSLGAATSYIDDIVSSILRDEFHAV